MKWVKIGKVFDPSNHTFANNCELYAQSPQAIEINGGIRVYFSVRQRDASGKFLSHISYADFEDDFSRVVRVAKHTVLPLGELGDFDEHGIFPIHIFRNEGEIWGYTTGWNRRVSVSADASIGLAISRDQGETFQRLGKGPILSPCLHEPFLIGDPCVLKLANDLYHMWYIFGIRWLEGAKGDSPDRVYKIGHAVSKNGIEWTRESMPIISNVLDGNECQALPSVSHFNGRYNMIFCYRDAMNFRSSKMNAYRLGYAFSSDLTNWVRDDEALGIDVSEDGWDSNMMCYPQFFQRDDQVWLLYNGNEFGRFGFGAALLIED
jgi:predicted GH43/DUF377 family glycosyl hydrolase